MKFLLLLFISILPVFLLGMYIYKKDPEKEPTSLLVGLFMAGFLSAVLVIIADIIIGFVDPDFYKILEENNNLSFYKIFGVVFFEIALVEEFFKWLMIRCLGYNNKEFDQLYDIIVYSVFVALGFAMVENIFYVLPGGVSLGIFRALFSVPAHTCFGVIMGTFLGLAKKYQKKDKSLSNLYMFYAILVPTLLHTIFNFCLLSEEFLFRVIFIIFVITLYVVSILRINITSKNNTKF